MKLKMYLLINNMTMTAFCELINYHVTYISKISSGKRKAGRKLAKIIEKATNGQVKMEDLILNKVTDNEVLKSNPIE